MRGNGRGTEITQYDTLDGIITRQKCRNGFNGNRGGGLGRKAVHLDADRGKGYGF